MLVFWPADQVWTMQVNILEAKNRLSDLIRTVQSGEEVVIAKRGEPVARLLPAYPPVTDSVARGSSAAILGWLRRSPLPSYAHRSAEEIDTGIAAERAA